MAKRALITGVLGQDGAYLAKLLLELGYEVFGGVRRSSSLPTWRLGKLGLLERVKLVQVDLQEMSNIMRTVRSVQPDELYNLAAQSFVGVSFEQPLLTADIDAFGAVRLLEAIRTESPHTRFYQASSSEMFGLAHETPQTERTQFHPRSPYGAAKAYAHYMTVNYREAYCMHASSGILFNHESPLRGPEFVTRKITTGLARIHHGERKPVELGNLEARRDWGFAGDYVRGMWLMLQQPLGGDYILATGKNHSVRDFFDSAAEYAGFQVRWDGEGVHAVATDAKSGAILARVDQAFSRPCEVESLTGDATKARTVLGWESVMGFEQLVEMMMRADLSP